MDAPTYVIVDGRTIANLNAPLSGGIKMYFGTETSGLNKEGGL